MMRTFTITNRGNKALRFDNKVDARGKRHYVKYSGSSSRTAVLNAWIKTLEYIPEDYSDQVTILLPNFIAFLTFEDNRKCWLENRCTKQGTILTEEEWELVARLDELIDNKNVKHISHAYCKSYINQREVRLAWNTTNKVLPIEIVAGIEEEAF